MLAQFGGTSMNDRRCGCFGVVVDVSGCGSLPASSGVDRGPVSDIVWPLLAVLTSSMPLARLSLTAHQRRQDRQEVLAASSRSP